VTIRRAPLPADLVPPACETPPVELGRPARPPHPAFGAGFTAFLGLALEFGALAKPGAESAGLLVACVAAIACLAGVMRFWDGTAPRHVPAKLAFTRPTLRWMAAAVLAIGPAVVITTLAFTSGARATSNRTAWAGSDLATRGLAMIAAASWIEISARGYAFRACMGRHGFAFAAVLGAVASVAGMLPLLLALDPVQRTIAVALEIPLSLALAGLVWRSGSLAPALIVRLALLAALASSGNAFAFAPAALVLWSAASRR